MSAPAESPMPPPEKRRAQILRVPETRRALGYAVRPRLLALHAGALGLGLGIAAAALVPLGPVPAERALPIGAVAVAALALWSAVTRGVVGRLERRAAGRELDRLESLPFSFELDRWLATLPGPQPAGPPTLELELELAPEPDQAVPSAGPTYVRVAPAPDEVPALERWLLGRAALRHRALAHALARAVALHAERPVAAARVLGP
ncbi:MAG: hypothetical protein IT373_18010 [Polyangiaceae bacterium]|nr:hypothetical protein [Polyangiaceae bacterium]